MALAPPAPRGPFGASLRAELWTLEADAAFLNHGSFGAAPRPVLAAQDHFRARLEARPTGFMVADLPGLLRQAAGRLADYVGARPADLAFVENATSGVNAVLRSLSFAEGDEILFTTHGYPAVRNVLRHVCSRSGAVLVEAAIPWPIEDPQQAIDVVLGAATERTRLAVIDHITSATGLVLPLADIAAGLAERGIPVLADGAHAPGQLPLDLPALTGVDWYTGNAHKWLCAAKGTALLWARESAQADLHPTTISHGYGAGFVDEFDWVGTRDFSGWLAIEAALDLRERFGDAAWMQHNNELNAWGGELLARRLGVEIPSPASMRASLCTLPLPGTAGWKPSDETPFGRRLWHEHRIEGGVFAFQGHGWIRLSSQVYNTPDEVERLADALLVMLA